MLTELKELRNDLANQVDRLERLGDYDANASVLRQLANGLLVAVEALITMQEPSDGPQAAG